MMETNKRPRTEMQPTPTPMNDLDGMDVTEKCDLIAELSESILENPSSAFSSDGPAPNDGPKPLSRMKKLLVMANIQKPGSDEYTAKLSILSLVALFQDILPSYRIRLPTAEEMNVRVSKETKKTWDYERSLLTHYQQFLKIMERAWDARPSSLSTTAILALCELLKSAPHFNFRSNILKIVIRQMNNRQMEEVSEACCSAIEHLFVTDMQGDIALEACRLVAKLVKDRQYNVQPRVLATFLALPLRVHVDEAQAAKLATKANAKKRKRNKLESEIESELKEGSGSVDKILLARSQSDTLQSVMVVYFSLLKSESDDSRLLPVALQGMAKFAHLINIDTVMDLLNVLRIKMKQVEDMPVETSVGCVLAAFQILQGPGRELKIDSKEYLSPLYNVLSRLPTQQSSFSKQTAPSVELQCLDSAFLKRREFSTTRVASFIKRLGTYALQAPPGTAAPILAATRQMFQRYPAMAQLLENEQDVLTSGQYDPFVQDPEHANPFATSAWELSLLSFHIHPSVKHHAVGAAAQKLLQMPMEAPERVQAEFAHEDFFLELQRSKKVHPLRKGKEDGRKRFVQPNATKTVEKLSV